MRVFNVIQQNNKRGFALFFGKAQDILHGFVLVGRHAGDYSLVSARFRHSVKTLFFHIFNLHVPLCGFPFDGHNRPVLATVQYIHSVNGLSRTQRFRYRVPSLHHQFVYLFFFHTFLL